MMTVEQLAKLNASVGQYDQTEPRRVLFFFDEGDDKPYRITDEKASESFGSYEELLEAAQCWNGAREQPYG